MENLIRDIRYGVRVLGNKPGFAVVAILTLALGIGANTAIFSVVNGVLLRPLPYADPDALVMVWHDFTRIDGPIDEWASPDNFFDWRDQNEVFDGMFALGGAGPTLTGIDEPEMLSGAAASWDAFDIIGVRPEHGRGFLPEEDANNAEPVVVLGHGLWQRRFGGDPAVVGTAITLDGVPTTVVGIMPEGFAFPIVSGADVFLPLGIDATNACGRGCVTLRAIARMKDGVSLEQAQANMDAVAARLEAEYPAANNGVGIWLEPVHERIVGPVRAGLWMLLGAVGFVLLIACANVANLMLARASGRHREVAIRVAIGAGSSHIFRQMLTESLLLAAAGGGLGLLVAMWGVDLLILLMPAGAPRLDQVTVDATAFLFALGTAAATGLLFGVVPALRATRPNLNESLKDGSQGAGAGQGGSRLRGALVIAEVALALTLLIGGGLMLRSFVTLINVDPGFDADNVLTQQLFLPPATYADGTAIMGFVDEVIDRSLALPGVVDAGVIYTLPLAGQDEDTGFLIEGMAPAPEGERNPVTWFRPVTPGYPAAMKMRLVRGRWLQDADHTAAPLVVMINEASARRYWTDTEPVGSRVTLGRDDAGEWVWREVVGIAEDTKHFGLDQGERPAMYIPFHQAPRAFMNLVLRTTGDPMQLARSVQAEVWEIDADLAVTSVASMNDVISGTVAVPRLLMSVLAAFAGAAMILAAIGIYGVMSYGVAQRIPEIGVRMALGAKSTDVLRLVVGRGMALMFAGIVLGLAASLVLSRFLESLLFEVGAHDPLTFVLVPIILTVVALVACYVPALRASRVDPIVALRYE